MSTSYETVAAGIERRLAREILRGERVPGSQLPPVRALAAEHGVTTPTIQRVIDRLEASGLVSVRRGSGVTVEDPRRSGDLSQLGLWLGALDNQPALAASMLGDFLELRRVVAGHLLRSTALAGSGARHRPERAASLARAAPRLAALLVAMTKATTLDEVMEADLAFTATVVEAAGQFAVASVLHTMAGLEREVPHLKEALYGDRAYHLRTLRTAASAVGVAGTPDAEAVSKAADALERVLAAWDVRTVARFEAALQASLRASVQAALEANARAAIKPKPTRKRRSV